MEEELMNISVSTRELAEYFNQFNLEKEKELVDEDPFRKRLDRLEEAIGNLQRRHGPLPWEGKPIPEDESPRLISL